MTASRPGLRIAASTVWVALALLVTHAASAQVPPAPGGPAFRPWRPVVSVAGAWTGAQDLGRVSAETRRAAVGTATPPAFTLFTTESSLGGAPVAEVALALPLTTRWAVAVRGGVSTPTLTTAISADAEAAPNVAVTEQVSDYTVDLSVTYQLARLGGRRARPFLVVGGGYVRQLHEDNVLVETGRAWHGGAGLRWWLRGGDRRASAVGVVGEARWIWRTGGIAFTDGARSQPAASVGLFVGF